MWTKAATSVTAGLDADKPSIPAIGDMYGATDTQKLYVCYLAGTLTNLSKRVKIGQVTRDMSLASGTQAITGAGFKPGSAFFFAVNNAYPAEASVGVDNITQYTSIYNGHNNVANQWYASAEASIVLMKAGDTYYHGKVLSFDADGLTVTWTKVGAMDGTATINIIVFEE